ncbi:MAG: hypothetical protein H7263_08695, partial [Candidatus Sericytochromatia bacterium]|nr:hypothetical protein [Candidatus Sericytochromatia bacterium]
YSVKKDFPLKGELFSTGDTPCDLLQISIDQKYIYLMTHISDPEPFTPVITVIETDKEKATQRFSIKDGTKILNIGFAQLNPIYDQDKSIIDLIVSEKLTTIDKVDLIKNKIEEEKNNLQIQESLGFNKQGNILETMAGRANFSINQDGEDKEEEIIWKITLEPEKIGFINITPGLDDILYEKCYKQIMTYYGETLKVLAEKENWEKVQTETSLRFKELEKQFLDKDNLMRSRVKDAVTKARQELEWRNLTIIRLSNLMPDYNFEVAFMRDDSLEWIREKERDELIETGLKTIATNCPNCNAQLLGSYSCRSCGFELDKPEDMVKSRLSKISTYHPLENLPQGHLIVTDTINHKIIEIDHFRRIVYELRKDVLHSDIQVELEMPRDAVRLKNNITLVVDYATNRVFKLTQKGRLFWELDYSYHDDNRLNKPVSVAGIENGNTVIVDQGNNRIIEVNQEHEIVWSYGVKGIEGIKDNMLRSPTFFQRTKGATNIITDSGNHRVIEVDGDKIVWQYGNKNNEEGDLSYGNKENQLNTPLTAWKFENGNFLILDSGNHRVIEVTEDKKIVWDYQEENIDTSDKPIRAFRLKTGRIMVVSEKKVVEVDYATKDIIWSASIDELNNTSEENDVNNMSENIKKIKVFHGVRKSYVTKKETENHENEKNDLETKKTETIHKVSNRSPVVVTAGANLSQRDFVLLDKANASVYMIDRQGINKWSFKNDNLIKPQGFYYNSPYSIYLADSESKKIIQVDLKTKTIIWTYQNENLISPKSVELSNKSLIVSDQISGRVIEIDRTNSSVIWEYKDLEKLKTPYHALRLKSGNTLITDWSFHIVYEISPDKEIVWSYGQVKKSGNEKGLLSYPEYAKRLDNGNTLICDTRNNRVIEVNPSKEIVWLYEGQGVQKLMSPIKTKRLDDGNTIIVQSNYKNIIEVDKDGRILWKYLHQNNKI